MGRLEGETAIITGAASGIGAATARRFVDEGAKVLIIDIDDERGQTLTDALGETARYRHVDVSQEREVHDVVDVAVDTWGRLDCMFNNAGIVGGGARIDTITADDFDRIIDVNLKGTFFGVKHAARVMKSQRSGSIVNNASVSGSH
jgi:NAD(P)-dependent dehydrogenase (short-subunit alcohol dehydrogenase family)